MLTKSAARHFFVIGTVVCFGAFILLTIDTFKRVPKQTNEAALTESAIRGKHAFDNRNCMGCHTILGEGAYYAPELTKVYERRGEFFIRQMLRDPEKMYPGQRKMVKYEDMTESEIDDFVAFLKWIGEMDLNGFPPKPDLGQMSVPSEPGVSTMANLNQPQVFTQMCLSCHILGGQGGKVGPALDGVGDRMTKEMIEKRLINPQDVMPGALMPKLPLSPEQITELSAFLVELKGGQK